MSKGRRWTALIAGLLVMALVACGSDDDGDSGGSAADAAAGQSATSAAGAGDQGEQEGVVKVENQDPGGSGTYKFVPSDFKFKQGEAVTLSMTGETEFHTFTVDELEIDESVNAGETTTFTVTFDRPGTYRLYCIPHEAFGMEGTITIE